MINIAHYNYILSDPTLKELSSQGHTPQACPACDEQRSAMITVVEHDHTTSPCRPWFKWKVMECGGLLWRHIIAEVVGATLPLIPCVTNIWVVNAAYARQLVPWRWTLGGENRDFCHRIRIYGLVGVLCIPGKPLTTEGGW